MAMNIWNRLFYQEADAATLLIPANFEHLRTTHRCAATLSQ